MTLKNKVLFITGASRGIGLAIGLRAAKDGAKIVVAAKTTEVSPKLPGTIYTAAKDIESAGGVALPLQVDVRDEEAIQNAVEKTIQTFGGIDILVNNASAIDLRGTLEMPMKRMDLMYAVNARATFACAQACIPFLKKSQNPHILMLSPPLNLNPKWFAPHLAYSLSKYGMSLCVLGLSEELKKDKIAVNALWPKTTIATAAVNNLLGGEALMKRSRTPQIVADAALEIFKRKSDCTGNFFIDEDVLKQSGVNDFSNYQVDPTQTLQTDLFI